MKTRSGYVSNSSSSSFLVYGNRIDFDDIGKLLENGEDVLCVDEGAGTSGDCGDFVFRMTKERFEMLWWCGKKFDEMGVDIINAKFSIQDLDMGNRIDVPELKGGRFFEYSMDYNSPETDSVDDERFAEWAEKVIRG